MVHAAFIEALKKANTVEERYQIAFNAANNSMQLVQRLTAENNGLKGELELANTFTNSKKDELLKKQEIEIASLKKQLQQALSKEHLYFENYKKVLLVNKAMSEQMDQMSLEISANELCQTISDIIEKNCGTPMDDLYSGSEKITPKVTITDSGTHSIESKEGSSTTIVYNTYNIYGTYNKRGQMN